MKLSEHRKGHFQLKDHEENNIRQLSETFYQRIIKMKGFEFLKSNFGGNEIRIYPATSQKNVESRFEFVHKQGRMNHETSDLTFTSPVEFANILVFNAEMYAENQKDYSIKHFDNALNFIRSFKTHYLPHNY